MAITKENEEVYKGVIVGDKKLEDLEKETSSDKKESESCVYGGIKLKDDLKEILDIPPKHTIFPKLDVEAFETDLQKCEVKCRWQSKIELREQEKLNQKLELKDTGNKTEMKDKVFATEDSIDFRNLKATDMKHNKRIIMPELDDDEDEIRRSNVKHELKEIFMRYREKNCDKVGNILENNLSGKQVKAIKDLKTKMKQEGLVCYKTDKTGKFAIDTVENYANKIVEIWGV